MFGISINTTTDDSPTTDDTPFHQKYCPECAPGINKMLVAVRANSVPTNPQIVWMIHLPYNMEVRGQVFGVLNKLILFVSDGLTANIIAYQWRLANDAMMPTPVIFWRRIHIIVDYHKELCKRTFCWNLESQNQKLILKGNTTLNKKANISSTF